MIFRRLLFLVRALSKLNAEHRRGKIMRQNLVQSQAGLSLIEFFKHGNHACKTFQVSGVNSVQYFPPWVMQPSGLFAGET